MYVYTERFYFNIVLVRCDLSATCPLLVRYLSAK